MRFFRALLLLFIFSATLSQAMERPPIEQSSADVKIMIVRLLDGESRSNLAATSKFWYRFITSLSPVHRLLVQRRYFTADEQGSVKHLLATKDPMSADLVAECCRLYIEHVRLVDATVDEWRILFHLGDDRRAQFPPGYARDMAIGAAARGFGAIVTHFLRRELIDADIGRQALVAAAGGNRDQAMVMICAALGGQLGDALPQALGEAARNGRLPCAMLLASDDRITDADRHGLISDCARAGHIDVLRCLLEYSDGAPPSQTWDSAFEAAAAGGHRVLLDFIETRNAPSAVVCANALAAAAGGGHLPVLEFLSQKLPRDSDIWALAMLRAAESGHWWVAFELIDRGFFVGESGDKILKAAVKTGEPKIVVAVLSRREKLVDPAGSWNWGSAHAEGIEKAARSKRIPPATVAQQKARAKNVVLLKVLLGAQTEEIDCSFGSKAAGVLSSLDPSADSDVVDLIMNSLSGAAHAWALHYAAEANDEPTVWKLLQSNSCGEKGREFALWGAASGGHLKIVEMILQSGPVENSLRAVRVALENGHWEFAIRLSEYLDSKGIVLFLPIALKMCRLDAIRGLTTSMIARKDEYGADEWKTKLGDAVLEMARPERLSMLRELLRYPFENHELLKLVNVLAVGMSDEVLNVFLKALPNDRSKVIVLLAQKGNWKVASRLLEQGPVAASELQELYALALDAHRIGIVTDNVVAFPEVDEADKRQILEAQCKALELAIARGYWKGAKILVKHIGYQARIGPLENALEEAEKSQNSETVQRVLRMMTMGEMAAALESGILFNREHLIHAIQRFVASNGNLNDSALLRSAVWAALKAGQGDIAIEIFERIKRAAEQNTEYQGFTIVAPLHLTQEIRIGLVREAARRGRIDLINPLLNDGIPREAMIEAIRLAADEATARELSAHMEQAKARPDRLCAGYTIYGVITTSLLFATAFLLISHK